MCVGGGGGGAVGGSQPHICLGVLPHSSLSLSPFNPLVLPHVSPHLLILAAVAAVAAALSHYLGPEVASWCLPHSVVSPPPSSSVPCK